MPECEKISTHNGYEVQILFEKDDPEETPEIFVFIARTDEQLKHLLNDVRDDNSNESLSAEHPELEKGLPDGKMVVVILLHETPWTIEQKQARLRRGHLEVDFTETHESGSSGRIIIGEMLEYPLKVKPDFFYLDDDGPAGPKGSPHQAPPLGGAKS